jgi:peptide deformylase
MAIRPILEYPDARLRTVAAPVERVDDEIRRLVEDMAETMYAAPGVGLAAPQLGVSLRVFVIDVADENEPAQFAAYINPEIIDASGTQSWKEGCLSFPGVHENVKRAEQVRVRALGVDGNAFELDATGLLAVAIQHENDHLNGVLMIDKVGPLQRRRMGKKLSDRHRSPPRHLSDD